MTPEETANNIISETQLIDNTWQEAHRVKLELVVLIVQAIREAVAEAYETCAQIADGAMFNDDSRHRRSRVAEEIRDAIREYAKEQI